MDIHEGWKIEDRGGGCTEIPYPHPEKNSCTDLWQFCQNLFHLRKDHGEFGLGINQSSSRDVQLRDGAPQTFGVLLRYDERAA